MTDEEFTKAIAAALKEAASHTLEDTNLAIIVIPNDAIIFITTRTQKGKDT